VPVVTGSKRDLDNIGSKRLDLEFGRGPLPERQKSKKAKQPAYKQSVHEEKLFGKLLKMKM
jgi:hypothetical protein